MRTLFVFVLLAPLHALADDACPAGERMLGQTCARVPESAITIAGGALPPPPAPRRRARNAPPPVTVSVATFAIDAYEVLWTDYLACAGAGVCPAVALTLVNERITGADVAMIGAIERRPIRGVTLAEASAYCAHVGGRLPTSDEWELAARGTSGRTFPWGEAPLDATRASYGRRVDASLVLDPGRVGAHPLGATPEGVHDLVGNVSEWVIDASAGEGLGVIRGGGFLDAEADRLRGASSVTVPSDLHAIDVGFRCAYGPSPG